MLACSSGKLKEDGNLLISILVEHLLPLVFFVMDYSNQIRGSLDYSNFKTDQMMDSCYMGVSTFSDVHSSSKDCFCKLLLTREEASEVLSTNVMMDKTDLEAMSGAYTSVALACVEESSAFSSIGSSNVFGSCYLFGGARGFSERR